MYLSSKWATVLQKFLPTAGNNHLGGDDFDQRIIDWMIAEFKKTEGVDSQVIKWQCRDSRKLLRRLR